MFVRWIATVLALSAVFPSAAMAQQPDGPVWHVMQDGVVYGLFNHQAAPRGGDEFRVPNWWMGMFSRKVGRTNLTINTMLSLDPLTVGKKGYRELFQVGEAFEGEPLVDYQHPHDLFMQLAAVWRIPIGSRTGFTLAGGPSAEPALGPCRIHASRLVQGKPDVPARAPYARFDAHRVRRRHGSDRSRTVDNRRLGIQRTRA
jgi:hypothetical protein